MRGGFSRGSRKNARLQKQMGILVLVVIAFLAFSPPATSMSYSWTFSQASDYTYDAAKISVGSGVASLVEASNGWWNANYQYRRQLTVSDGRTAATDQLNGGINDSVQTITVDDTTGFPESSTILIDNEQINCGQTTVTTFTNCARGANGTTPVLHADNAPVTLVLPTGYSVRMTDGSANAFFASTQADGDDWRIAYYNGSSWSELDRDLVTYTSSAYDAWFKTQAPITAGGTSAAYYAYYGYAAAATPTVNRNNVYQLYEQFTYADGSLANWSASGGTWEIEGNAYRQTNTSGSNLFSTYNTLNLYDFVIEADVNIVSGRTAGLSFRVDDGFGGEPYYAIVDSTLDQLRLLCGECGAIATYATTIDNGTTYTIRVASLDDNYKVSLNGTQRIDVIDPDDGLLTTTSGELGFQTYLTHARFDNLKIRKYVGTTEPTFTVGSATTRYPTDDPTIQPMTPTAQTFTTFTSFAETATKNGGEIRYLLSNDGGSSWLYWSGSAWVASDGTVNQTTTAAQAYAQRASFPTGSGSFLFQAFFDSDGTQLISLDTVAITGNTKPAAPTFSAPSDGAQNVSTTPTLQLSTTDPESDEVRYQIQIDTVNTFTSANLQTFDQTTSQVGWTGQEQNGGTSYASGATASYAVQTALQPSTTYYLRGRAIDPSGANTFSNYSATRSFVTLNDLTINQLQATVTQTDRATIAWTTSRTATAILEYGTTTGYGQSVSVTTAATSQSVTLTNLAAEILYHVRVTATDTLGQTRISTDVTFTTTTLTTISSVTATVTSPTTATIAWTTNHAATSKVNYGTTTSYGSELSDTTTTVSHSLNLTNLTPNTTYHYQITSVGNSTATTSDATLTTTALTEISNMTVTVLAPSTAKIQWTTNHLATSHVEYGPTNSYGKAAFSTTPVLSHEITLEGLTPKTTYHYRITSIGNSTVTSADATFRTPAPLGAPTIVSPEDEERLVESRPTIFGYARSNHDVFLVIDGSIEVVVKATNHASGTGSFRYTLRRDLALGSHTLFAISRSPGGDISEDAPTRSFTIRHPSIAPTLFSPILHGGTAPAVTVRGIAANDSVIELFLDETLADERYVGYNPRAATIAFSLRIDLRNLADGLHRLKARAIDLTDTPSRFSNIVEFTKTSLQDDATLDEPRFQFTNGATVIVESGDSLWTIAERAYGDGVFWPRIVAANSATYPSLATQPHRLTVGWHLIVPR